MGSLTHTMMMFHHTVTTTVPTYVVVQDWVGARDALEVVGTATVSEGCSSYINKYVHTFIHTGSMTSKEILMHACGAMATSIHSTDLDTPPLHRDTEG